MTRAEQMSLDFRYVYCNVVTGLYEIKESFVSFVNFFNKTGQGISDAIQNERKAFGLNLDDMRGQAYDIGSNIKGKNIGVKKKILETNSRKKFKSTL